MIWVRMSHKLNERRYFQPSRVNYVHFKIIFVVYVSCNYQTINEIIRHNLRKYLFLYNIQQFKIKSNVFIIYYYTVFSSI